ncbi:PHP domain-containing protein [Ignavibacterium sp.]|uniref:PHP domain-containing protein n=1 Tax=Ignavibacterium sp. TaxID=2651167 RepID=UPI002202D4D5|nr:PHP domain-containing protein [Ignavibacterium sp.]BDQ02129.1 MAG: hypothetical protein KatS3mg037_0704 [Ignavibacterium sp.]
MIPLNTHSYYSLLTGASSIEDIVNGAKNYNLSALALTDTNGMYGLVEFHKKAKELNIKPILGSLITDIHSKNRYAIFLAKNKDGYKDLCSIITSRKLNEKFDLDSTVKKIYPNLIIISPNIDLLDNINPANTFYGEAILTKKQRAKTKLLIEYSKQKGIKVVLSNPIYFLSKDDFIVHKLLRAIDENTTIENISEDELLDEEYYFKHPDEISSNLIDSAEFFQSTEFISNQCNVELDQGKFNFPSFPNAYPDAYTFFYKIVYEGFERKYSKPTQAHKDRLQYEIDVISSLNFIDYFLIVWDIVQEAKRRGMLYIGRGSAANSMVAYCLDLTQIEPISNNLFFERFLNRARSSPPDVDIDFSWKERDEIIKYVFEKYGYQNVAMISTHVTFRARSAFRETAKAFGISESEISNYSRKIPWTNAKNLPNISALFPESKSLDFSREPWKTIINLATRIANYPRHLSIHPGGIVITPTKVTDYCALEYAKNKGLGLIITQPDMYSIEDLGLIKIDLLSQRSLGVLRDAMKSVRKKS